MNDYRALRSLLAALAPLGLAAAGCGSSIDDEFDAQVCVTQSDGLSQMTPVAGTDFIALRQVNEFASPSPTILSKWGTECATASDSAACMTALNALAVDPPLTSTGFDALTAYDVAITRGDEALAISTSAALLELLGPIDTPNEAALVAFAGHHEMLCGQNNLRKTADGYVLLGTRGSTCGGNVEHYEIIVSASGQVSEGESEVAEYGEPNCAIGRRPDALRSNINTNTKTKRARSVGQFFANAAHLEAASVHAFEQLAGELAAHAAPRALVRAALRSRADEIRHALATARMARRFGGRPARPVIGERSPRALFDVALDNATEGCVRETFGALVATVQAGRARDPLVRRSLRAIAADETRHAVLSWAIDAWARRRLPSHLRRKLDEARRAAVEVLRREVEREWADDVIAIAGMPRADASARMVEGLNAALWTA